MNERPPGAAARLAAMPWRGVLQFAGLLEEARRLLERQLGPWQPWPGTASPTWVRWSPVAPPYVSEELTGPWGYWRAIVERRDGAWWATLGERSAELVEARTAPEALQAADRWLVGLGFVLHELP